LALLVVLAVLPVSLLGAGATVSFLIEEQREAHLRSAHEEIAHVTGTLEEAFESAKADTRFLSLCPPIGGMIRALAHGGIDPQHTDSLDTWKSRLAKSFAYKTLADLLKADRL
jgi:hypothetical protein